MTVFVGLLRAVNVGGTGKLPMAELQTLCRQAGFADVRTYIQSGNVVFTSPLSETAVKAAIERALLDHLGKPIGAIIRSAAEMASIAQRAPFPGAAANQVLVYFLDEPPPPGALDRLIFPGREKLLLEGREVYAHFPDGIGRSKLKLPFAASGTARNLNTVAKLATMMRSEHDPA